MNVELIQYPKAEDWMRCKMCTLVTVGKNAVKEPTYEWKQALLRARHSPIRELHFCFRITDLPYWISVHLVRHVHAQPYVRSQRNDRQNEYDRNKAPQDTPVNMFWSMNAEELITIMNKRLCKQTHPETKKVVEAMRKAVLEKCPVFEKELVPMCVRNGGVCYEMFPCNKTKKNM